MAGNVNEWVMDVYRDLTFEDMEEFRPFRGNEYTDYQLIIDPRSGDVELTPEAENYFDYSGKILKKPVRDEACFSVITSYSIHYTKLYDQLQKYYCKTCTTKKHYWRQKPVL